MRYSEQMIRTTSGIVAILRAFLSSSKSRSISGVMATVIFGVGSFLGVMPALDGIGRYNKVLVV